MNPQRILAVQVKMIGDLLLTLPALQYLRETWPTASLELITLGPAAQLAPCLPWIDRVHRWNKRRSNLSTLKALMAGGRPDLSLDFSGTDRAALFTALGRERIGYQKYLKLRKLRGSLYTKTSSAMLKHQHASSYYLGLLEALELASTQNSQQDSQQDSQLGQACRTPLHLPNKAQEEAALALGEMDLQEGFVAIQAGSARSEKCWPAPHWAQLIQVLHAQGMQTVLLGGNDSRERDHLERIELLSLPAKPLNLAGKLSLPASLAVLKQASALLSVDSALMHAAATWNLPHLALFGSTHPHQWGPWNPQALILHAAKPELAQTQAAWDWKEKLAVTAMKELPVDAVLSAVEQLLQNGSGADCLSS